MNFRFIVPRDHDQQRPSMATSDVRVYPPSGLARMAGYAGTHGKVSLVDERIDGEALVEPVDIAIIFTNVYNRQRAYELAQQYREHGAYIVFTGPLMNQWPEEACEYADCLFIGDGEEIMPTFLRDYWQGVRRRLYGGSRLATSTAGMAISRPGLVFGLAS